MKTAEDEAFEDLERRQGGFHAKRQAAMDKINAEFDEEYIKYREAFPKAYFTHVPQFEMGWNAALDAAASRIGEIKSFGQATQDSFAVFIQGLKK